MNECLVHIAFRWIISVSFLFYFIPIKTYIFTFLDVDCQQFMHPTLKLVELLAIGS